MPRAFLIKKKKCYADVHGHDGHHHHVVNSVTHQSSGDDEGLFPKTKKRKSYEAMSTRLKNEVQTWSSDKQVSYDSGSESGCYSTSSRSPSPNMTTTKSTTVQTSNYGHHQLSSHHQLFHVPHVGDTASAAATSPATASAILDPLKLSPVQWMRPFLAPYLPINFPYPYHHPHQLSAEAPYQQFGGSRASPLYQSRVEPPSPSYPCPLSPYTPPARDANHKNAEKKRVKQLSSPSPSSSSWSDVERCCSNESSDMGDDVKPKTTDLSGTKMVTKRRTTDTIGGSARYQCPDCHKSYSTYSGLSKHQQFHCTTTNKRSFSCKFCEKVYLSLGALKMHIRTHTLPCKCNLCGKAFSRPWLLQGHIRTHTGEKPFSCSHCNRAFADRSNLRAHLQTHSDIKKYSCKMCSKTFSRMSLLLKHEDSNCCSANSNVVVNNNQ